MTEQYTVLWYEGNYDIFWYLWLTIGHQKPMICRGWTNWRELGQLWWNSSWLQLTIDCWIIGESPAIALEFACGRCFTTTSLSMFWTIDLAFSMTLWRAIVALLVWTTDKVSRVTTVQSHNCNCSCPVANCKPSYIANDYLYVWYTGNDTYEIEHA